MKKILIVLIGSTALFACSSNNAPQQHAIASAPVEASAPVVSAPVATPVYNSNSVYFAFDKYDINSQYAELLKTNGTYLATATNATVQVQGNTDDIGSVEYNLSLGQKRADAVKKALIITGANKSQIEATSNGKLKPRFTNNSSDARSMNRRADINYHNQPPAGYSNTGGMPLVDQSFYNGVVNYPQPRD